MASNKSGIKNTTAKADLDLGKALLSIVAARQRRSERPCSNSRTKKAKNSKLSVRPIKKRSDA